MRASSFPFSRSSGVNVTQLREQVGARDRALPKQSNAQPSLSREMNQILDKAEDEAKALGDEYISTEHLLLALAETKGAESRTMLRRSGRRTTRCSRRFRRYAAPTA